MSHARRLDAQHRTAAHRPRRTAATAIAAAIAVTTPALLARTRDHTRSHTRNRVLAAHAPAPKLDAEGDWSFELEGWLDECLRKAPSERSTAAELLSHEFLDPDWGSAEKQRRTLAPL
eukprot:448626-Prymnesium_polylepis.1